MDHWKVTTYCYPRIPATQKLKARFRAWFFFLGSLMVASSMCGKFVSDFAKSFLKALCVACDRSKLHTATRQKPEKWQF